MKQKDLFPSTEPTLRLSQLRAIYTFADKHGLYARDIVICITNDDSDFNVSNDNLEYRFIKEDDIDKIQQDELEGDPYILGCFNAWFIANNTDLSLNIVEALQKGEQFTELGEHIINNNFLEAMQEAYSSEDGYGHHFAGYDFVTHEDLLGLGYYAFRTN